LIDMRSRVSAFATLLRPPNVFTSFADSLAGVIVVLGLGYRVPADAWSVVVASGCLYLSGIVFNDVFDRRVDARERPNRPIPCGGVPVEFAVLLAVALMAVGIAVPWLAGTGPGMVAAMLAAAVLTYDGLAKSTIVGPLVMGACRSLNMGLGVATGLSWGQQWPSIAIAGPLFLGLYVAGLTYVARDEVGGNSLRRARIGLVFLAVLAAGAVSGVAVTPVGWPWVWAWLAASLALGVRNWAPVWRRPDGPTTGRAIGGGITLIPVIDAVVCAAAAMPGWAALVALLALPAVLLKRFYSPT
jgi:4-hydroxybenzoate polyprenyltransferase